MEYLSVAQARELSGPRLVLTTGVPGPWGESAKAVLKARNVGFLPVAQQMMAPNEELVAWTGHRNAPILCLDEGPPLTAWLDIVLAAERIGSGPSLVPDEEHERALCFGLLTEIASTDGLGWNRRLQTMATNFGSAGVAGAPTEWRPALNSYGVTSEAIERAGRRVAAILTALADQLRKQRESGSDYLVGRRLSALDLYWACFSLLVKPIPEQMPEWLVPLYGACDEVVSAALDPILFEHRDRIYERHIGLPLDY